jgi:hypothetical protein
VNTFKINLSKKSGILLGFFLFYVNFSNAQNQQYHLKNGLDISLAVGSTALLTTTYFLQKKTEPLSQATILLLNREDVNAFDRMATHYYNENLSKVSDGLAIGSILMQSYFYFNKTTRSESFKIGTVAFQSLILSQAIANTLKLTLRNRPYLYNENVAMSEKQKTDGRMSFFSAHTTMVSSMCFSFALAHQTYMPASKANNAIWVAAFTLPAIEGFLRVRAGKHFPTDVIVGYLVGMGTSFLMHKIHLTDK